MSTSPSYPEQDDNFQRIHGIKSGIERRLHSAQIRTYADLASKNAQDLAQILKGVPGMDEEKAAELIAQARDLAEERAGHAPSTMDAWISSGENLDAENLTHYENFRIELRIDEDHKVSRTRITHLEDSSEMGWPGWEGQKLLDFIEDHAMWCDEDNRAAQVPSISKNEIPELAEVTPIAVAAVSDAIPTLQPGGQPGWAYILKKIGMYQFEVNTVDKPTPSHILKSGEAFKLSLGLDFGQVDETAGVIFDYSAEVYAHELNTSAHQKVAAGQGEIVLAKQAGIEVEGIPLPTGVYRMEAVVTLTPQAGIAAQRQRMAFLDGGLFQVD